jgi:hypothetical protein
MMLARLPTALGIAARRTKVFPQSAPGHPKPLGTAVHRTKVHR